MPSLLNVGGGYYLKQRGGYLLIKKFKKNTKQFRPTRTKKIRRKAKPTLTNNENDKDHDEEEQMAF